MGNVQRTSGGLARPLGVRPRRVEAEDKVVAVEGVDHPPIRVGQVVDELCERRGGGRDSGGSRGVHEAVVAANIDRQDGDALHSETSRSDADAEPAAALDPSLRVLGDHSEHIVAAVVSIVVAAAVRLVIR